MLLYGSYPNSGTRISSSRRFNPYHGHLLPHIAYISAQGSYLGPTLGSKYVLYTYMDPLGYMSYIYVVAPPKITVRAAITRLLMYFFTTMLI